MYVCQKLLRFAVKHSNSELIEPLAKSTSCYVTNSVNNTYHFCCSHSIFSLSGHKRLPNEKKCDPFSFIFIYQVLFQIQIARFIEKGALKCNFLENLYICHKEPSPVNRSHLFKHRLLQNATDLDFSPVNHDA